MSNQVKVIDILSGSVLFTTTIDKIEEAYAFAAQMEEAGLDLKIDAPGLTETLIGTLGATTQELEEYKKSMQDEIDDHDFSDFGCAVCPPDAGK